MPNDDTTDAGSMTAEKASARLEELKGDSEWTAKLARGDYAAGKRWNELYDAAHGTETPGPPPKQPEPRQFQATPVPDALGAETTLPPDERPPASPGSYSFHMPTLQDETTKAVAAEWQQTAYDVQLPGGMFTLISQQAAIDAERGLDPETHADNTDKALHKMFGADYDAALAGAQQIVASFELQHPGLRERLQAAGLSHNLVLLTWLMRKGLQHGGS